MKKLKLRYLLILLIPVWGLLIYGIKSPHYDKNPSQKKSNAIRISADSTFAPGQNNQWRGNGIYSWAPSFTFTIKRKLSPKNPFKNNSANHLDPVITVDTTEIIEAEFFQAGRDLQVQKLKCLAYQVKLENNGLQPWKIGYYENSLPLYQEALNEFGNWIPIEKPEFIGCTSQSLFIEILSGEWITTNLPLYEGDYQTKIRLVWTSGKSKVVSNSFTGRINKEQFLKASDTDNLIKPIEK